MGDLNDGDDVEDNDVDENVNGNGGLTHVDDELGRRPGQRSGRLDDGREPAEKEKKTTPLTASLRKAVNGTD
jgi:hypothetical protein